MDEPVGAKVRDLGRDVDPGIGPYPDGSDDEGSDAEPVIPGDRVEGEVREVKQGLRTEEGHQIARRARRSQRVKNLLLRAEMIDSGVDDGRGFAADAEEPEVVEELAAVPQIGRFRTKFEDVGWRDDYIRTIFRVEPELFEQVLTSLGIAANDFNVSAPPSRYLRGLQLLRRTA
jgi:hypothetical protein